MAINNILFPLITDDVLLTDWEDGLWSILEVAQVSVKRLLQDFAQSPEFATQMKLAFGQEVNVSELQESWTAGDFSALPQIEVRSRWDINGANGAYAAAIDRIFISEEFLRQNAGNLDAIARLVLEEVGHAVDTRLNESDSLGDEGAIFSAVVRGETLSSQELASLRAENDTAVVTIDGQTLQLEQDNIVGTDGNDVLNGTADNDTIDGLGGNDSINGLLGDDFLIGGLGNDALYGEAGNDTLDGGEGNDYLLAGQGINMVIGGSGDDRADFDYSSTINDLSFDYSDFNNGTISDGSTIREVEQVLLTSGSGNDNINIAVTTFGSFVAGGLGNDTIQGGLVGDRLLGEGGNDIIFGGEGHESGSAAVIGQLGLFGGDGDDQLFGEGGNDALYGEAGNDTLDGGEGSDYLDGGAGLDTLVGVNSNSPTPGLGERDILVGGTGADRYVLGDAGWIGYDDHNSASNGTGDYATISGFVSGEDVIQLQGPQSNYRLEVVNADTQVFIDKPGSEPDELIAVIQGVTGLALDSSDFDFIEPVNTPPTTSNNTLTTAEDVDLTFATTNFSFSDPNSGDSLQAVGIETLPDHGILYLDLNSNNVVDLGEALAPGGSVAITDLNAGHFKFEPDANESGSPYTAFTFSVSDGVDFSTPATFTLNVTSVNDAPTTADNSLTTEENIDLVFTANDYTFTDVDTGDTLQAIRIDTLPSDGTVYVDANNNSIVDIGETLTPGNSVTLDTLNAGQFKFKPDTNENGTPYSSFTFSVSDGIAFSNTSATLTLNVTPVNNHIIGTPGNDGLIGTDSDDFIDGQDGNDALKGLGDKDILRGVNGCDRLLGGDDQDILVGGADRDLMLGGSGDDVFRYESLTESLVTAPDRIGDFNQPEGDRFQILPTNPEALFNAGSVSGIDLTTAVTAAYADKNGASEALGALEAVFFTFGARTYLSVNDNDSAFSPLADLVVEVSGITFADNNTNPGLLAVDTYFI
jgi:Ca2+-binding RTX toxin-like protein